MNNMPYDAPNFTLPDSNNQEHSLSDYRGKWVVLYFYPKDGTPGCTVEACSLRDSRDDILAAGAEVIGVSRDTVESHKEFAANHQLNFTLLSDTEGTVIEAYGASNGEMAARKTFVINPEGQVVKAYDNVTPEGHGQQIVADLAELR